MPELRVRNANCQKSRAPENCLTPNCRTSVMSFVIRAPGSGRVCLVFRPVARTTLCVRLRQGYGVTAPKAFGAGGEGS